MKDFQLSESIHVDISEQNISLTSVEQVKKNSHLDSNFDDNTIRVAIRAVQDMIVEDVIGTCIMNKYKALICSGAINDYANSLYKQLLDQYISQIFNYGVPAEVNIPITHKLRNAGNVKTSTETTNVSSTAEVKYTQDWYMAKVDFYVHRAIEFIKCNGKYFDLCCTCGCCGFEIKPFTRSSNSGFPMGFYGSLNSKNKRRK